VWVGKPLRGQQMDRVADSRQKLWALISEQVALHICMFYVVAMDDLSLAVVTQ
jgi:hypothetical protein